MPTARSPGRLIPHLIGDGPTQMAIDTMLLAQATEAPVLRFYRWDGPWLSLGRHQRHWPQHWHQLTQGGRLRMVRRPSGGQAVLHAGGLTYALIWPSAPRRRKQAYREACQWLIDGFTQLGLPLRFGDDPALAGDSNCFASATAADLVDPAGVKRIGSAQCWQRGRLLQHGEILLDPPPELWQLVFGEAAPPAAAPAIDRLRLEQQLIEAMAMAWPEVSWKELPLSEDERDQVEARSRSDGSELAAIDATI